MCQSYSKPNVGRFLRHGVVFQIEWQTRWSQYFAALSGRCNKELSYCRGTARRSTSVKYLSNCMKNRIWKCLK